MAGIRTQYANHYANCHVIKHPQQLHYEAPQQLHYEAPTNHYTIKHPQATTLWGTPKPLHYEAPPSNYTISDQTRY